MPYKIPAMSGKPYRPSNGTEGEMFEKEFCHRCTRWNGDDPNECDISMRAFFCDVADARYPIEWTHDSEGQPMCTAFENAEV